jgi:hypothetical protein
VKYDDELAAGLVNAIKAKKLSLMDKIGKYPSNFWIKLNIDQTGFCRVKYDDELAAGLVNAIKAKKLSLMDKIGKYP